MRGVKYFLLGFAGLVFCGCATVNFSGNYYVLPPNYRVEVDQIWQKLMHERAWKNPYKYAILKDSEFQKSTGIPAIAEHTVIIPENFLKYIYQNYYEYRGVILASVITHELCHVEFGLPSQPPQEHFKVDQVAMKLLGNGPVSATSYYQSLYVMRNYWFARKGMAGHAFNVGWNAAQVGVLAVTGHGHFADWFATDLEERMRMISRSTRLLSTGCFPRSPGPRF